nr:unnamed protein product [Spirometra erinaceieuropaei]
MRSLLGDMHVDDKFVKEMFLERLPSDVQTILAPGSQDLTVSQLAEMEDRVMDVQRFQSPFVAQISTPSSMIPVATDDVPKTAVTTPFGLFEFVCVPFGLRNAAQTFKSRNEEEHKEHLALMFDRLDKFGVVINPSKCMLGGHSLEFLGHQADYEGLRPLPFKVEAVRDFASPTSKHQLQPVLGMVNFYRRFLPNYSDLMMSLTNMLFGPKGPLELTGEALTAFERIKNSLADATLLTHPAPESQLSLMVDASPVAVGAVLQQHLAGSTRPLA